MVLIVVAVHTEVLPVRSVGRVVVVIAVPVVDCEEMSVLVIELARALGADESVNA